MKVDICDGRDFRLYGAISYKYEAIEWIVSVLFMCTGILYRVFICCKSFLYSMCTVHKIGGGFVDIYMRIVCIVCVHYVSVLYSLYTMSY